jgi:hypothetical protein
MSQRRFLSLLAVFAVAMAAMSVAVQPSFAEDDDDDEPNFMSKLLGSVGLLALPGPAIDYRERAPLVVPPVTTYVQPQLQPNSPSSANSAWDFSNPRQQALAPEDNRPPLNPSLVLPPPVDPSTVQQRNPNFPVDPETKAAQKRKKNTKKMFSRAEDDPSYSGRRLTPAEMAVRGNNKGEDSGTNANVNDAQSTPQRLGVPTITNLFRKQKDEPVQFTGEPERTSLTQPPAGYLTPAQSAPYGVVGKDRPRDTPRKVHPNMPDYAGPIPSQ